MSPKAADQQVARLVHVYTTLEQAQPKLGTGYLVSSTMVLTALHVVRPGSGTKIIQFHKYVDLAEGKPPNSGWMSATLAWPNDPADEEHDLALLTLEKAIARFPGRGLSVGKSPSNGQKVDFRALGFPFSKPDDSPGRARFELFTVFGSLDTASASSGQKLHLTASQQPPARLADGTGASGWSGLSGGPVFAVVGPRQMNYLVGVVSREASGFGSPWIGTSELKAAALMNAPKSFRETLKKAQSVRSVAISDRSSNTNASLAEAIARGTIDFIDRYEHQATETVITLHKEAAATGRAPYDQESAFRNLEGSIGEGKVVLLGGPTGVGKSVLMRKLARSMAEQALRRFEAPHASLERKARIPIALHLGRVKAHKQVKGSTPGKRILDHWLRTASKRIKADPDLSKLVPSKKLTVTALRELAQDFDLIAVFDGADEFFSNNPDVAVPDLAEWLQHRAPDRSGRPLFWSVVVAHRVDSPEHPTEHLPNLLRTRVRVARFSEQAAKRWIGSQLWDRLATRLDEDGRRLLRTPLVLNVLQRTLGRQDADSATAVINPPKLGLLTSQTADDSPSELLRLAMRAHLYRDGDEVDTLARLETVAASVGFALAAASGRQAKELPLQQLRTAAAEALRPFNQKPPKKKELDDLIRRTLLQAPTHDPKKKTFGKGELVSFAHPLFADLATARMIAMNLAAGNLKPLERRVFYDTILRDIGYFMRELGRDIDRDLMESALRTRNHFIYGALVTVLSYSTVTIKPEAVKLLEESLPGMSKLAVHVLVSTFGSRVLAPRRNDPSRELLKETLERWCPMIAGRDAETGRYSRLTVSLASCLHAELTGCTLPACGEANAVDDMVTEAADIALGREGSAEQDPRRERSLQDAYVSTLERALQDRFRITSAAHYAVLLFALLKSGALHERAVVAREKLMEQRKSFLDKAVALRSDFARTRVKALLTMALGDGTGSPPA